MKALLSIGEAATRLGLSVDTVRVLERTGELKAVRTPGGHRRFDPAVLDTFVAQRSGTPARRKQAPRRHAPPQPARRKQLAVARDEEPDPLPDEEWDQFESFDPTRPAAHAVKAPSEQVLAQARESANQLAEETRLSGLRAYGQSQIPYGVSAGARSAVIEMLDGYVTASRFPASTGYWTARPAIDAKVAAILEPFKAEAERAAARKAESEARKAQQERDDQRMRSLIESGRSHASWKTVRWERDDRDEARAEVLEALEDEVEADWSEGDVRELVDEVLEAFAEESGE